MSMKQLTHQYEEQLKSVKAQIKTFEKENTVSENIYQYRSLKKVKKELQDSIKQMKHYL